MFKLKQHRILIIFVLLLLISCLPFGCWFNSLSPSGFKTYRNDSFQYVIDYPNNWSVIESGDAPQPEQAVYIRAPSPYFGEVAIFSIMSTDASPELTAKAVLEVNAKAFDDFVITANKEMISNWDWYFQGNGTFDGENCIVVGYYRKTPDFLYRVEGTADESVWASSLIEKTISTFSLLSPPAIIDEQNDWQRYTNYEFNYCFEYPIDWELESDDISGEFVAAPYTKPHRGHFSISCNVLYEPPLEDQMIGSIKTKEKICKKVYGSDIKVLESRRISGKWDWYICYEYVFLDKTQKCEEYFKVINDGLCILTTQGEKMHYDSYGFKHVIDSFALNCERCK